MRFTRRSIRWRRQLERKKELVEILGGKVAATHSTAEVAMRHAPQSLLPSKSAEANVPSTAVTDEDAAKLSRLAYARRRARRQAPCSAN
jgi:hypothetical protein